MSWYAVEALDDAIDATKALLTPFDARTWLKLAVVVFFLGSTGATPPTLSTGSPGDGGDAVPAGEFDVPFSAGDVVPVVIGVVAVAVVIGLVYALIGSIMEFVFVESLRRRRVRIRAYADQHFGRSLRLFGFRIVLGLAVALPAIGAALAVLSSIGGNVAVSVGLLVALVPVFLVLGFVVAAVNTVTTNFVVPVMILENETVLGGWRRLWPTLVGEWKQFGVYALVWIVLSIGAGILASTVGGIVGAALAVPAVLIAVVAVPAAGGLAALVANPAALAVVGAVAVGYFVAVTALVAVAFVPIRSYLRYHALLVLGDADAEFDLVPELRREIRE